MFTLLVLYGIMHYNEEKQMKFKIAEFDVYSGSLHCTFIKEFKSRDDAIEWCCDKSNEARNIFEYMVIEDDV